MADHRASGISMAFIKDGQVLFLSVFFLTKKCYPQKHPLTEPHILRSLSPGRCDASKKERKTK